MASIQTGDTLETAQNSGVRRITIPQSAPLGYRWFDVPRGRYIKFVVSDGHGGTYDVVTALTADNAVNGNDVAMAINPIVDTAGVTAGTAKSATPGIQQIGINLTVTNATAAIVMELSAAKA